MSVVLYKNGGSELFSPHNFKEYLTQGWFFNREESLNGMRKREEQGKGETEQAEEVKAETTIKRKYFKCAGCGKRKSRFPEDILYNDENDRFCSEECLNK